ncbi:ABC transporter transmembrane domain-containing protein [Azospirillum sp. ST 5-10]|uniref:ABC transporter transmembrane domain-containing protein n=1 Tax=unclassified Azospirillum TaxID=2630922 RepID=UPI003F4A62D4
MESSIYRFILRHSVRQQIVLLLLTLASFPFLYASLDLPKRIVNEAIAGSGVPDAVWGIPVDQISYLLILCGAFLGLVLVNGAFKYVINTFKGRLGERMLRRLRYELYARVLRFPLPRFRKMSSGEMIPMITAEVEPLGGFIGDAFAVPVFQGGTLLVYIGFIFVQDPVLGGAAVSLYPFQGWLIPRLQRRVNQLGKRRVRAMRTIADRIGETVAGVTEVHAHDTSAWHLADVADRLGEVYDIRFEIYQRKFFIKFLNNFINQLTPFFFYSIGGYLVIEGELSFGALVAVLAAYKDLAAPWKELLDWYQQKEDNRIKYEQVVEQFQAPDLMEEERQRADVAPDARLSGTLAFSNVSFGEDGGAAVLDGVNGEVPLAGHTAVVGTGAGKEELAQIVARLLLPTGGRVLVNGEDYAHLPEALTGRRIAYVGGSSHLFAASLYENLVYGLRHRPLVPPARDETQAQRRRRRAALALSAGNTDHDVEADWIDYAAAGCSGPEELMDRIRRLLRDVDLEDDVYAMGLNRTIDPTRRPDVAARILEARVAVAGLLQDGHYGDVVERFDPDRFNSNATVAENLLFGTPVGPVFAIETLAENPYMLHVLDKVGLTERFLTAGRSVAATMVELFSDLPPGHEFFERFSFIDFADLPEFQAILARADKEGVEGLRPQDRTRLLGLPFRLIPARHRLGLFKPEEIWPRLVEARRVFAADLPGELRHAVEFFDPQRYNAAASIQDNILFGKVVYGQAQAQPRVGRMIGELMERMHLRDTVVEIGLEHPVGIAGSRLSSAQRQKTALVRALLKAPDLLVIAEATAGLDAATQARIHAAILRDRAGRGLFWVVHRADLARGLDRVLVLRGGRIVEQGRFDELEKESTVLRELMAAE